MVRILKLRLADALRCAALLLLAGCGSDDADQTPAAAGIEQTIDRGAFSVVIKLDNAKPSIADRLTLSLEVNAEEAYEVTFPSFDGDALGEFGIVDRSSTLPELIDGARTRRTRTLTLEPFLSGDYVIAPMTFTFQKGSEAPLEVETEEIKIVVASLLPTAVEKLEIHEIEGPVTMAPPSRTAFWLMLCGIILVIAVAGGGFYWWSTKQSEKAAPIIIRPAHEIALDALQDLLADDLPGKGEIKEFYSRISDILRRYIENRFGIHAPGQTTEEFLVAQRGGHLLQPAHQQLLTEFLRHCDLVKFAEHDPLAEDLRNTIGVTKQFISETKLVEQPA